MREPSPLSRAALGAGVAAVVLVLAHAIGGCSEASVIREREICERTASALRAVGPHARARALRHVHDRRTAHVQGRGWCRLQAAASGEVLR
jgi:hypothetical protein